MELYLGNLLYFFIYENLINNNQKQKNHTINVHMK